jgi:enoyl-CoA hydratase/carnithine racemase
MIELLVKVSSLFVCHDSSRLHLLYNNSIPKNYFSRSSSSSFSWHNFLASKKGDNRYSKFDSIHTSATDTGTRSICHDYTKNFPIYTVHHHDHHQGPFHLLHHHHLIHSNDTRQRWRSIITSSTTATTSITTRSSSSCSNSIRFFSKKKEEEKDKQNKNTKEPQSQSRVIIHDLQNGIKHVQLNRPEKLNSLDMEMFHAIANAARALREDTSVRVILLSGKGRAFCTGLDVKSIMMPSFTWPGAMAGKRKGSWVTLPTSKMDELLERPSGYQRRSKMLSQDAPSLEEVKEEDKEQMSVGSNDESHDFHERIIAMGNLAQDIAYLWRDIPVPVIAVLTGMCYGGGLQLALGADFRYSTRDCRLSVMESKWGFIPDMGASITQRELVRMDVAKELAFTGRVVQGEEGEKLGLVTRCSEDPMADALEMANVLIKRSPDSIAAAKHLFQRTWTSSESECLELETRMQKRLIPTWNQFAASVRNLGVELPYGKRQDFRGDDDDDCDNMR